MCIRVYPCMTYTELDVQKLLGPSLSEQNSDSNAPCISLSTRHQLDITARDQSSRSAAPDQLKIRARDQQLEIMISRSEIEIRALDQQLEISSRSELEISSSRSAFRTQSSRSELRSSTVQRFRAFRSCDRRQYSEFEPASV